MDQSRAHLLGPEIEDGIPLDPLPWDLNDSKIKEKGSLLKRSSRFITSLSYQPIGTKRGYRVKHLWLRGLVLYFNIIVLTFGFCLIVSLWDAVFRPSYTYKPEHYNAIERQMQSPGPPGYGNPTNQKIFIGSNIIQYPLIKNSWGENLLKIINFLGPENVFVSIYENDSGPETPVALSWLRDQLNCQYSIVTGDHIALEEFPTVVTPGGDLVVKRLSYLAEVRNRMLWPLDLPGSHTTHTINYTSTKFDRILFLNDIYYTPEDAMNLLFSTNHGDYDVACAIDFWHGATIYDTFVLRDTDQFEVDWFTYPWFTTQGSAKSRSAVLAQSDAVPVKSCFNGLVAYNANEFLQSYTPASTKAPLRFRSQSQLFWEASECCLINADLNQRNPKAKMFINPYIRVAYSIKTWVWEPRLRRIERGLAYMQWWMSKLRIIYEFNPRRTHQPGAIVNWKEWKFDDEDFNGERIGRDPRVIRSLTKQEFDGGWKNVKGTAEAGGYCGQRRLFALLPNFMEINGQLASEDSSESWKRIKEPPGYY